jgi:TfoX/Sxy family transcriptional regulator of competence genes
VKGEKEIMSYNQNLEARIQKIVSKWKNTGSKKMFGGICHLLNGNMFCGVYKDFLILRLGGDKAAEAFKLPHVKPFDITGRPMKGWVMVEEREIAGEKELKEWLEKAKGFVKTLGSK